jgi:hypothetical protein
MPVPNNNPGQISSIAPEQQYGVQKLVDEQTTAAPMLGAEPTPGPQSPAPLPDNIMPRGGNVVDVLPPINMAPAASGRGALPPQQQVAYAILNLPGVSGLAKSLASQLIQNRANRFDFGVQEIVVPEPTPTDGQAQ